MSNLKGMKSIWMIRGRLAAVGVCMIALIDPAWAGTDTGASAAAINQAGRQRMLTQRIVLVYCQIGLGVAHSQSQAQLAQAIALFENQLTGLEVGAPTQQVAETLVNVRKLWEPFRSIAEAPVERDGAAMLLYLNDDLLHASNKVVQLLQDISGQSHARLVNIAGRQRMLSQRAAKFYMLTEWGFDTLTIRDELEAAKNDFAGGLAALRRAPQNTAEIDAALDAIDDQWAWFRNSLNLRGDGTFRQIVAETSEAILNRLERLIGDYQRLDE